MNSGLKQPRTLNKRHAVTARARAKEPESLPQVYERANYNGAQRADRKSRGLHSLRSTCLALDSRPEKRKTPLAGEPTGEQSIQRSSASRPEESGLHLRSICLAPGAKPTPVSGRSPARRPVGSDRTVGTADPRGLRRGPIRWRRTAGGARRQLTPQKPAQVPCAGLAGVCVRGA